MTANKYKAMVHFLIILVVIVACSLFHYCKEKEDVSETECEVCDSNGLETKTRQLVYRLLSKISCDPKYTEEERIQFEYQGVFFLMDAVDDCQFVNIIWPWCHSFSKFDIDEFARVRQVVNEINAYGAVSVFYNVTDSDEVAVHMKKHFLFVPQIPDLEGYLKCILDVFFRTARALDIEIEKKRMAECEN